MKLLLNSKVKGRTLHLLCLVYRYTCYGAGQSRVSPSCSMSDERVRAARNLLLRGVESLNDCTTPSMRTTALDLRVRILSHVVHPLGLHLRVLSSLHTLVRHTVHKWRSETCNWPAPYRTMYNIPDRACDGKCNTLSQQATTWYMCAFHIITFALARDGPIPFQC